MNRDQLSVVRRLTSRLAFLCDGLEFAVEAFDRGELMVTASNAGRVSVYTDSDFVLAIVGPRGGVKLREASSFVRKMIRSYGI